jgi:hypothetical protein
MCPCDHIFDSSKAGDFGEELVAQLSRRVRRENRLGTMDAGLSICGTDRMPVHAGWAAGGCYWLLAGQHIAVGDRMSGPGANVVRIFVQRGRRVVARTHRRPQQAGTTAIWWMNCRAGDRAHDA